MAKNKKDNQEAAPTKASLMSKNKHKEDVDADKDKVSSSEHLPKASKKDVGRTGEKEGLH